MSELEDWANGGRETYLTELKAIDTNYRDLENSGKPASSNPTTSAPAAGGLFGSTTATAQPQSGGLFGAATTTQPQSAGLFGGTTPATSQPQAGGLFGASTTKPQTGGSLFGGLGSGTNTQQQGGSATGSLFGGQTATSQQPQAGGMFGSTLQKPASTGGSFFGGASTTQQQNKPSPFGGFGTTTTQQQQQQPQQQQGPTLSLFGNQNAASQQQQQQQQRPSTVPGVKIDVTNLVPTTKFESCSDELQREIEAIDTYILNQIRMCNEVSDVLPSIKTQGQLVPNDVEFVQGKLDTLQEALENDASGIDHARSLVARDAAEAKLAFRALDTLLLPLQYQPSTGDRWWSSPQQSQSMSRHSLRSALGARHSMLALPEDAEADSTLGATGGPTNLVDYFSQRSDEMNSVVEKYRTNLKEIEDHLHGVETTLSKQLNELSSRARDSGAANNVPSSRVSELAGTLADVESAILGVAARVGGVREEVQEAILGPLASNSVGATNGW
ncbi:hypothetical protein AJ80_04946 [Polytolypa hystricis UAMH7299]|uniref:Nucleoporin NUP49/NSP49 n=1 Tax=Polytolypa hystricis (strain UAMH7299) TaxID=1447883 RepID=A0A2B7Y7R3_POLH7|nr:hypothetical protein AJ80_04946 [Polytolypa hystricis UAMH7299]